MAKKVSIGLDIGSSAIRAAEVVGTGQRKALVRFGQVGLPAGAVVEGEVRDRLAVSAALRRLWQECGFSSKRVVLGLSSQRTMVRQVEMPKMPDAELRSAIRFKIGEFLPVPVEQVVADFAPLPGGGGDEATRRVLLVAAQRDGVLEEVRAVEEAGLNVGAVDASSLALLRAARRPGHLGQAPAGGRGLEAVVNVGSQLITVAVRDSQGPRFVRTVAISVPQLQAEAQGGGDFAVGGGRPARPSPGGALGTAPARTARVEVIVSEVRSSLEYLLSQTGDEVLESLLLTGAGASLKELVQPLSAAIGVEAEIAALSLDLDRQQLGLDEEALEEASYRWLTAAGLALWATEAGAKLSLMPAEVAERRQLRYLVAGAGAALFALVVVLGAISYTKIHSAHDISGQIKATDTQSNVLEQEIRGLGYVVTVPAEVESRRALAVEALSGDIDWVRALTTLEGALPADVVAESVAMTKTVPTSATSTGATSAALANPIGEDVGALTMEAETKDGAKAVAQFIDRLSKLDMLRALWVTSTTNSAGVTTIQATADLTGAVLSSRAAELPGGHK